MNDISGWTTGMLDITSRCRSPSVRSSVSKTMFQVSGARICVCERSERRSRTSRPTSPTRSSALKPV